MIKFIATDLDGTLLHSDKTLPQAFETVLDALNDIGVQFAIASGRQYDSILNQFKDFKDKITIIAENGAIVFEKGRRIICEPMDTEQAVLILRDTLNEPGLYPIACGVNGAFGSTNNDAHLKDVTMYYTNYRTTDNVIEDAKKEQLLKIAVYDEQLSENHSFRLLKKYSGKNNAFISGEHWVDIMKKGITKGSAIEHIQALHGYTPDECMSFGDYMNDADMMRVCGHSCATANAHPDLKKLCKYIVGSNDNDGVINEIRRIILKNYKLYISSVMRK